MVDSESSVYAAEGTVAHGLTEACFESGVDPSEFLGQVEECDGHQITIDQEMVDSVRIMLDVIDAKAEGHDVYMENRITHSRLKNETGQLGGTLDVAIPAMNRIIDLKYGAGVKVEAENNSQLMCYAILFFDHFKNGLPLDGATIEVTIVQPRINHAEGPVRSWEVDVKTLQDFYMKIKEVMDGKRQGEYNAGDHCQFCPKAAKCSHLADLTLAIVNDEFEEAEKQFEEDEAAKILTLEKAILTKIDAVKKWARDHLVNGGSVPGFKIVDALSNRSYRVGDEVVVKRCRRAGFGKTKIYESKLLSPAKLEKIVGKEVVSELVHRKSKGATLVPESDKREAIANVLDDFEELENMENENG